MILQSRPYTKRHNAGGNFCGHDPQNPDFNLAKPMSSKAPLVIQRLCARLPDYFYNPKLIPTLNLANGSSKQQRSEARNRDINVLNGLLKFVDLASLRVGIPTKNGFQPLTVDFLAKHIGMEKRRVERALSSLVKAQLITSTQRCRLDSQGEYKGLAAIRCISARLWSLFGLGEMLKHERKKASERLKQKAKEFKQTLTETARTAIWQAFIVGGNKDKQTRKASPVAQEAALEAERDLQIMALGVKNKHPNWHKDQCYAKAKELLFKKHG